MNIVFLIIIYNRELKESSTYRSFIDNHEIFEDMDTSLLVWNNGIKEIFFEDCSLKKSRIEIINSKNNTPLSNVYNRFINSYSADYYVVLDDDSYLTKEYFEDLKNKARTFEHDLILPLVTVGTKVVSPNLECNLINRPTAIASGMIISSQLLERISAKYGSYFDERFVLYAVDYSFMCRASNVTNNVEVIRGFEHDKSTLGASISDFRRKELGYALGLKLRYYFELKHLYVFLRSFGSWIIFLPYRVDFLSALKVFILGKHPNV
ncbi:glycosyltransferase family 2 protein [Vibrio echinoideorum]|uniref:glycosyltransferase family 2 protein n=1 Tax=Vibrio echinoideorum TaxID=2100116 RepID=UPI001081EC38|nr:glycosyltransferase [Vibrio echinoideorum]